MADLTFGDTDEISAAGKSKLFSEVVLLNAIGAITIGEKIDVGHVDEVTMQVDGITTATVQLEGSLDGTNFYIIGAALTADGVVSTSNIFRYVRAHAIAWTSGTITALLIAGIKAEAK